MVKLPDTLLREMRHNVGTDKTATYQAVLNKYLMAGYGPNKAKKWINTYLEIGVLEAVKDEDGGQPRLWCLWW